MSTTFDWSGSNRSELNVNGSTMKGMRKCALLVGLLLGGECAIAQSTFEKLLPDLSPGWGNTYCSSTTGDLTFSAGVVDQLDSAVGDIALLSLNQHGDTLWTRVYGRPYNDNCFHLLATSDGGYLLTGNTATNANAFPEENLYLIRTDSAGDTLWTRAYRFFEYNTGRAAMECADGGFLVVGSSDHSGWYNGGLFIIKINELGDVVWTRFYDHLNKPYMESTVSVRCATLTANGDFFVAGTRAGYSGVFLSKFDSIGDPLWCRKSYDSEYIDQLESTPDGGLILSGDFNSNPLLVRSDPFDNTIWSKAYDGVAYWGGTSFVRTFDNGIAVTAQTAFQGEGSGNAYFLQTDSAGGVIRSRTYGDTAWDAGRGIVRSLDGGYYVVALRSSSQDYTAVSVIKTDASGDGHCFMHSDTTLAVNVQLNWIDVELQSFSSFAERHPSACSIRRGTTVLPLCPVGLYEATTDSAQIRAFPNPTSDGFTVSIPSGNEGALIEIFSSIGERVYHTKAVRSETWVDRGSFTSGVYLVKVTAGPAPVFLKVALH